MSLIGRLSRVTSTCVLMSVVRIVFVLSMTSMG